MYVHVMYMLQAFDRNWRLPFPSLLLYMYSYTYPLPAAVVTHRATREIGIDNLHDVIMPSRFGKLSVYGEPL